MDMLKVLYQDSYFVAIDKPPAYHVHQPEDSRFRVRSHRVCLNLLRDQLGKFVYPVHRLDAGTSGVLLFALTPDAASLMGQQIQKGDLKKTYHALVRGYTKPTGEVNIPLKSDSSENMLEATTHFSTLAQTELPHAVGKRHTTARYSLIQVQPLTGRYHQIRRHMARISHPLIGDIKHGDSHHNRFFREQLGLRGLFLRASRLEFTHPFLLNSIVIESPWNSRWEKLFEMMSWPKTVTSQTSTNNYPSERELKPK